MIVDSSAIVAIISMEAGYAALLKKLADASWRGVGAPTLVECGIVLSAKFGRDSRGQLSRLLEESGIDVVYFTEAHFGAAVTAWLKYGKSRHPAALNFGDCLAYAVARLADMPLLCVGDDFAKTDLSLA